MSSELHKLWESAKKGVKPKIPGIDKEFKLGLGAALDKAHDARGAYRKLKEAKFRDEIKLAKAVAVSKDANFKSVATLDKYLSLVKAKATNKDYLPLEKALQACKSQVKEWAGETDKVKVMSESEQKAWKVQVMKQQIGQITG